MRYRFFICKPYCSGIVKYDDIVSRSLRRFLLARKGLFIDREDMLLPFDAKRTIDLLRVASGGDAGSEPKFKFFLRPDGGRDNGTCPLFFISAEYGNAQEVADALEMITHDQGLTLFDGEMNCETGIIKQEREKFIAARLAYRRYMTAIRRDYLPCKYVSYFKLGECFCYGCGIIDTAVSVIRGDLHCGFKKLIERFHEVVRQTMRDGESMHCENGCFVVEGKGSAYRLRFVVEGPGKCPMYMGWVEDGEVRLEVLRRMGIYRTRKSLGAYEEENIRSRLYFDENFSTRGNWRNPADRFVDNYRISKQLEKNKLDIIYGRHPDRSHNEFVFYVYDRSPTGWDSWRTSSFFTMPEEQVLPLLLILNRVVPDYWDEYYYEKFHFRKEETERILEQIKSVKFQMRKNPFSPLLEDISKMLLRSDFAWVYPDGKMAVRHDEKEKREILFQNRFRIVALLDFFAGWLERQRNNPNITFNGFYVQGP